MTVEAGTLPKTHGHGADDVDYLRVKSGAMSWIVTLDHKRIGLMYLISVLTMFFVGGVFALLVRTELLTPGRTIMDPHTYTRRSRSTAPSWCSWSSSRPSPAPWAISLCRCCSAPATSPSRA
jgi:Heme/copper-type cytochrome/quinol oxidases, subunit 1